MSGALRKTMIYLGLAEDDDRYAAYDDFEEDEYVPAEEEQQREEERRAPVTPIGRGQVARVVPSQSAPERHRITTIHPRTYNEARTVGEHKVHDAQVRLVLRHGEHGLGRRGRDDDVVPTHPQDGGHGLDEEPVVIAQDDSHCPSAPELRRRSDGWGGSADVSRTV